MGSMPKPPDPYATAQAQSQADMFKGAWDFTNKNISEYTPYGSKTYNQSGTNKVYDPFTRQYIDVPTYSSHVSLAPGEQNLLNLNTQMRTNMGELGVSQSDRMKGLLSKSVDTAGLQGWNAGPGVQDLRQDRTPTDRAAVEDAMIERYQRYAKPQNEAQDVQMSLRGMSPGSQGYATMQQAQGDQFSNATREAFLASGDEARMLPQEAYNRVADQRFNQGGAVADRGNALRQNQLAERLGLRNQDYNEMAILAGLAPINTPQFNAYNAPDTNGVPIGQYVYDDYNARSTQAQNKLAGIADIGKAVAGALPWASWLSDRRAKTDIMPIGAELAGVPLYTFKYWGAEDTRVGVMADEAKVLHPDAVRTGKDGFDRVDYGILRRRHVGAMDIRSGIIATANELGMDPVDLATIISYETGGTFDPTQGGPTTKWGKHRGLIQFGEPQARQYGVDWNDPLGSQLGPGGAVSKYFTGSGWKPGMGMLDAYSIVNAGGPGRYNASDAGAGGAPGSVRDKVERQMGGHRQKAAALLGDAAGAAPHVAHPPNPQVGTGGYVAPSAPTTQPGAVPPVAKAGDRDKYAEAMTKGLGGLAGMSAPTVGSGGAAPRQMAPQSIPTEAMPIVSEGGVDRNAMAMLMARLNSGQLWV